MKRSTSVSMCYCCYSAYGSRVSWALANEILFFFTSKTNKSFDIIHSDYSRSFLSFFRLFLLWASIPVSLIISLSSLRFHSSESVLGRKYCSVGSLRTSSSRKAKANNKRTELSISFSSQSFKSKWKSSVFFLVRYTRKAFAFTLIRFITAFSFYWLTVICVNLLS